MKYLKTSAVLGMSSLLLAACTGYGAQNQDPARIADGVLTGGNGMTLYTFDRDASGSGKSVCNGPCAINWPPLLVMEQAIATLR